MTDSENVVGWIYKKCRLRRPFGKQHGKRAQALLIPVPESQHLYFFQWSLQSQLSWKKSPLLTCKILVLLVNTLAADEKFPVPNRDNLPILFLNFILYFLNLAEILKIFKKKDDPHRFCLFEITASENVVR